MPWHTSFSTGASGVMHALNDDSTVPTTCTASSPHMHYLIQSIAEMQ